MKAQWTKLKFASKYGRKKDLEKEENVEEDFLYKIEPNPEPMFKNTISKSVTVIRKTLNLILLGRRRAESISGSGGPKFRDFS